MDSKNDEIQEQYIDILHRMSCKYLDFIQGAPYVLGRFSSLKELKSGPKDMDHPVELTKIYSEPRMSVL